MIPVDLSPHGGGKGGCHLSFQSILQYVLPTSLIDLVFRRLHYTVIGDAVNVAQRLQSQAEAGQIIITDDSYQKVKESFKCREVGSLSLKNKSTEVLAYEVLE